MSVADNVALIRRLADEVLTRHDLGVLEDLFHPDYVEADPPPGMEQGVEGFRSFLEAWFEAFPDTSWTIEEQIADGDRVFSRSTFRGTHSGAFFGIPATNQQVSVAAWTVDRVRDGKVSHSRLLMDNASLMQQLGVGEPPT